MLLKSRISNVDIGTEHWRQIRLGRFTSSNIYKIMGDRGISEEGLSYIRTRVFEHLSGVPSEPEITNEYTAHGLANEGAALRRFAEKMGLKFLVVQKFIEGDDEKSGSTPDALIIKRENSDGLSYEAATVEVKSFQAAAHVMCASCETPQELKQEHKKTYWQVIHQMITAKTLEGYAVFDHPELPLEKGGNRVIHFHSSQQLRIGKDNKPFRPIVADIAFMKERLKMAYAEFDKIKEKLCTSSTK